jgi:hypothetical protein
MAGYSKTKLIDKLGIKPGFKIHIINAPEDYFGLLGELPEEVKIQKRLFPNTDFIHFFTTDKKQFEEFFPVLKLHLSKTGLLWISWPKGSSKVKTDVNENIIREIGLREGPVDIKVCAVDEIWSGLKFVYRVKDRK